MDKYCDRITFIMKPTNECNMRCSYCYHYEKGYKYSRMSLSTFKEFCQKSFPYLKKVGIIWHGGEPLIMGLDFYKKTLEIIQEYKELYGTLVNISFQSNGTLLNKEWIDWLKENQIGIGLSFDGLDNEKTRGHTEQIVEKFDLLKKHKQGVGVIQVLNSESIKKLIDTYNYYKSLKVHVKFNKIFKTSLVQAQDNLLISPASYVEKMSAFFDYWMHDKTCNIRVDPFDEYVNLYYKKTTSCSHGSCLFHWMSIDSNGNLSPCGRNYSDDYSLGNLNMYHDIREAFESKGYISLLEAAVERRKKCLDECELYEYCKGGCNNDKLLDGKINDNNGTSCQAFKGLFSHIKSELDHIEKHPEKLENLNPFLLKIIKNKKEHA